MIKKICLVCEKEYTAERKTQKLCSVACKKVYQHGAGASQFKTGRSISPEGYVRLSEGYEHRVVAEKALGKPLPPGAVIHHVDGDKANNAPSNLVICPNQAYHGILHQNRRVLDGGGEIGKHLPCSKCKGVFLLKEFSANKRRTERLCKSSICKKMR